MYKNWNMFLTVLLLLLMEEIFPSGTKERRTSGGKHSFKMKPFHSRKGDNLGTRKKRRYSICFYTVAFANDVCRLCQIMTCVSPYDVCRLKTFVIVWGFVSYVWCSSPYDVCRLWCCRYDVCRLDKVVAYDVCSLIRVVAYNVCCLIGVVASDVCCIMFAANYAGLGMHSFQKNATFLRSFAFFIKERCVLLRFL